MTESYSDVQEEAPFFEVLLGHGDVSHFLFGDFYVAFSQPLT